MKLELKKKKVFIGPCEISGYYNNLANGLREIGYDVSLFIRFRDMRGYPVNNSSILLKWHRWLSDKRVSTPKSKPMYKGLFVIFQWLYERFLFIYFLITHDVFVFTFMKTFFRNGMDLFLLRFCNKKVIVMTNGSDVRPVYISGKGSRIDIEELVLKAKKQKEKVSRITRFSDVIVSGYLRSQFCEGNIIDRSFIGRPIDFKSYTDDDISVKRNEKKREEGAIRVVHAPSDRNVKGTDQIVSVISKMQKDGYDVYLVLIEGKSNNEVLSEISASDIVIDQLYSDILLPGISGEAGLHGKPAIVGGYELGFLKKVLPRDMIPPVITCHPNDFENTLKCLVEDARLRVEWGTRLKKFVETKCSLKSVALNFEKVINDEVDCKWVFNTKELKYFKGVGVEENQLKKRLSSIVEKCGFEALQIDDKPRLKKEISMFIEPT